MHSGNTPESQVIPGEGTYGSLDQTPKKRKRTAKKEQKEKRKKDKMPLDNQQPPQEVPSEPIVRQMVPVLSSNAQETGQKRITIMTYNLLAQSLVRREIFPESGDAIKWKHRRPRLLKEILHYEPDVSCFQEMDHSNYVDTFKPEFENAGYETCFSGIGKTHGCCIIWKRSKFTKLSDFTIEFDRFGLPTMTTNCIGLIVSLKCCETLPDELNSSNSGLVIGTTHLYWRPQSMYERARQCLILCENLLKFKEESGFETILAGDFNSPPTDPTYKLMVKNTLTEDEILSLKASMRPFGEDATSDDPPSTENMVEENSVDSISDNGAGLLKSSSSISPSIQITQQTLPSMSVGNTQTESAIQFKPTLPELLSKFASLPSCVSLYARHLNSIDPENTIYSEPKFTNYGLYFKGALDYIFLFCQNDDNRNNEDIDKDVSSKVKVTKLLKMPPEEELLPLLPNYKFNSDHLCLMAELVGLV
ncbi:3593_t:CDS:2 [Dentiscutata heterogama]|uniref:3593_t:CDS:1 n=1 Tax=Dentiscutata heterogama TaxID=1316150 RepID=A0ACA9KMN7_9GLOM|nr:3593_t:CDS:2 [Dentiscutata heterogama]